MAARKKCGCSRRDFMAMGAAAGIVAGLPSSGEAAEIAKLNVPVTPYFNGGWTMYMFADRCNNVMLSTLFQSPSGKLVMIDGGWPEDGGFLLPALKSLGGVVDAWFLTHAHFDHYGALADIIKTSDCGGLQIKKIIHKFLPIDFIAETESDSIPYLTPFLDNLAQRGLNVETPSVSQVWDFGEGLTFECLNDYDLSMRGNSINNSSICYRVMNGGKSILITGDIGWPMADKMLETVSHEKIKSDIVFLSHHGQNGANKNFYEVVNPEICVWPTVQWLWDNNSGGQGYGSGPWLTNYVKCWMQDIGVKRQFLLTKDAALGPM